MELELTPMSGREFGNSFTFLWPTAKIAVMGGEVIAGVMSIVRRGQAARKGVKFNEKEDAEIVKNQQIAHDKGSVALKAIASSVMMELLTQEIPEMFGDMLVRSK